MKPYAKTYRASKVHPAKDCSLCSEEIHDNCASIRQGARAEIEEDINEDLSYDEVDWNIEFDDNEPFDHDHLLEGLPTQWDSTMDFVALERDSNDAWDCFWDEQTNERPERVTVEISVEDFMQRHWQLRDNTTYIIGV